MLCVVKVYDGDHKVNPKGRHQRGIMKKTISGTNSKQKAKLWLQ